MKVLLKLTVTRPVSTPYYSRRSRLTQHVSTLWANPANNNMPFNEIGPKRISRYQTSLVITFE